MNRKKRHMVSLTLTFVAAVGMLAAVPGSAQASTSGSTKLYSSGTVGTGYIDSIDSSRQGTGPNDCHNLGKTDQATRSVNNLSNAYVTFFSAGSCSGSYAPLTAYPNKTLSNFDFAPMSYIYSTSPPCC